VTESKEIEFRIPKKVVKIEASISRTVQNEAPALRQVHPEGMSIQSENKIKILLTLIMTVFFPISLNA
jgi:hypothetical protein